MITVCSDNTLDKAISMLQECITSENESGKFNYVYPMTTENIVGYMPLVDNYSSVCTVIGSGDHVLNAIAAGALEVDAFDANAITIYLLKLKAALIKKLNRANFIKFFTVAVNWETEDPEFFNEWVYRRYRGDLDNDTAEFWDTFYVELNNRKLTPQTCELFRHIRYSSTTIFRANYYLSDRGFRKLRARLNDVPVNAYCCSLVDLDKTLPENRRYTAVLWSNISDYISNMFYAGSDKELLKKFDNLKEHFLKKRCVFGGTLLYAYIYEATSGPGWTVVDNLDLCKEVFTNFKVQFIPAMCRLYKNAPSAVDAVLFNRKEF